jgi:hypothetical protein
VWALNGLAHAQRLSVYIAFECVGGMGAGVCAPGITCSCPLLHLSQLGSGGAPRAACLCARRLRRQVGRAPHYLSLVVCILAGRAPVPPSHAC